MKKLTLVIVLLLGLTVIPAFSASAHDASNRCGHKDGSGAGWWKNRGHGVSCKVARAVARRWEKECISDSGCSRNRATTIRAGGYTWHCAYEQAGYESVWVKCEGPSDRIVHFYWGS